MTNTIGSRETEKAIQLGLMYNGQGAAKVGLVDEVCSTSEVETKAEKEMKRWIAIPGIIILPKYNTI